jgi:sulfate adenylyltransferase subunit 1
MENVALPIVIVGHVDHGKSTLIGRLLYGTGALTHDRADDVSRSSAGLNKDMEYAFALDALEEEREGAMTIDTTQAFFSSKKRRYTIVDAPGHKEFLKNMITGTSYAEAAVLVVDVAEGVQEQTKRHAYLLNLVGLRNIIIALNKMDLALYDQQVFATVQKDIIGYLNNMDLKPQAVIPISARAGDNIVTGSDAMPWYQGPCLLEALDGLEVKTISEQPLRYPVQDVYEIDGRKVIVGRIESGEVRHGMDVYFLPSAKKSKVAQIIKYMKQPLDIAGFGEAVGLVLDNGYTPGRGEVIAGDVNALITKDIHARVFWFDGSYNQNELVLIKHTTQSADASMTIMNKLDPAIIEEVILSPLDIEIGEVAEVMINLKQEVVIDLFSAIPEMGRFIIEKEGIPVGGGIVI